jgi:flagellar secretion chaperone FliS
MTSAARLRSRYAHEAVATASPTRLVTMLYDRLARDLDDAESAICLADLQAAHHALRHAQDIVQELLVSLDVARWPDGKPLQGLYAWLVGQLVTANLSKDASVVLRCREIVEPLREAWHEAANAQQVTS